MPSSVPFSPQEFPNRADEKTMVWRLLVAALSVAGLFLVFKLVHFLAHQGSNTTDEDTRSSGAHGSQPDSSPSGPRL